ncbi:hypothetical protein M427DRAFT_327485 [Gonapodya prolifera JEL478]|uniref:Uncharacterized protein n=1 Tax=Gonapodya prolifera (strain JEL478) TaxID=1344416 RepID=A0A139AEY3_GONPJ|nr:hypothetical protein M427DRAFT_327485 [Gonapodya prolifera JEL478]|eukprot:KXS15310.1 hypothetical protein M427DRAFT_327485 [Gonapodya prolifera JEL478]
MSTLRPCAAATSGTGTSGATAFTCPRLVHDELKHFQSAIRPLQCFNTPKTQALNSPRPPHLDHHHSPEVLSKVSQPRSVDDDMQLHSAMVSAPLNPARRHWHPLESDRA